MIVEADFSNCARGSGESRLLPDHCRSPLGITGELMRLVGMDADRGSHLGPHALDPLSLPGLGLVPCFEDHERALEPRVARPADDVLEIVGERVVRKMAMAVDHSVDVQMVDARPAPRVLSYGV